MKRCVQVQQGMVTNVRKLIEEKGGKGNMQEVTVNASHSPFVSQPVELGGL